MMILSVTQGFQGPTLCSSTVWIRKGILKIKIPTKAFIGNCRLGKYNRIGKKGIKRGEERRVRKKRDCIVW
jgi:hypothetical protein